MPVLVFPKPLESAAPGITPVPIMPQALVELDLGNLISGAILDDPLTATLEWSPPPWSPADIAGLLMWYDFSVAASNLWQDTGLTSAVTANGQTIKGVTDKSGVGNHLTEATNGPTYITAGQNGLSIARFDGTDDRISKAALVSSIAAPYTIMVAAKFVTSVAYDPLFDGDTSGRAHIMVDVAGSGKWGLLFGAGIETSTLNSDTNSHVFQVTCSSGSSFRVDGGTTTTPVVNNADTLDAFTLANNTLAGSTTYANVDYYELAFYTGSLSLTDINLVGNYLATKWGTTWTTAT